MKNIKTIIAVSVAAMVSSATMAQNLNSAYFADGHLYRHESNPAFGNENNYIAMPGIGNLSVNMGSNIGVDNIFYNVNGRTVTFLHPSVSTSEFLSGVNNKNRINESGKLQILGTGFKGMKGYNTIEINVRENVGLIVPGSILRLAKEGPQNKTYDISDFNAHADAYTELALGHSHQINDNLRIGAKFKMLFGLANVDANFNKAQLTLNENGYTGIVNAEVQSSIKGLKYEQKKKMRGADGHETEHEYVSDIDVDGFGLNGFGLAVDLGAEYKLDNNWKFSAALLDLGFINYSNNMVASTRGDQTINTNDYIFNMDDEAEHSFENEGDRLGEGLANLYELHDMGDKGSRSKGLAATMNLGVQYTPDFYDKLSFGLLNSTRMAGKYSWTEFRVSANVAPSKIFTASANVAAGTYGASFGWLLDFHPKGFNLFLGMDHTLGKLAKQGIPLSGNGGVSLGMNFPF
ncbi:MAG: hypothetical protein KBT29_07795 [Prevotellaceae bacterium]|nr:hypothetical protein [Candidatus Minthosoma caballi]